MIKILKIHVWLCSVMLFGSCLRQQRVEPTYPKDVSRWEGRKGENGIISRTFVLRKNEASDNGQVQIKVIEIIPGDPLVEAGSFNGQARARIQFSRMSDGKKLCEETYPEHGGSVLASQGCGSTSSDISYLKSFGISAIVTLGINLKDEWVYFSINGHRQIFRTER